MADWQTIEWARKQAQDRARTAQSAPSSDQSPSQAPSESAATPTVQTYDVPVGIDNAPAIEKPSAPKQEKNWLDNLVESFLGPDKEEIRAEQQQLSEMGLYVSEGHRYYNDGEAADSDGACDGD